MKKIIFMAIALGVSLTTFAENGGGLFNRGSETLDSYGMFGYHSALYREAELPLLPCQHDLESDQPAPVGGGMLLLIGFGTAYALARKRKVTSES